jgi:UDP-N-acetylmuramoyl-L-alanyl-D-glutamate--2,6-diaminopimelate ligase
MTLQELLRGVELHSPAPDELCAHPVAGLDYDSRRILPNYVFFAFRGERTDGRQYAQAAVEKGALAVLSDLPRPATFTGTWLQVKNGHKALAEASKTFYGRVDEQLGLTGITGTNGKTTTAFLTDSLLRAAGNVTGLISTIEYHIASEVIPAVNTTPESLDLLRLFHNLAQRGGHHATMEVSSHALALGRIWGLHFHTAVFTNFTRDHLDFHHTMEDYYQAKCLLFQGCGGPPPKFAVINSDDSYAAQVPLAPGSEKLTYGIGNGAAVKAGNFTSGFEGLEFQITYGNTKIPVRSRLVGRINVYNILAACAVGLSYGLAPETITRGIQECRSVPGRFERVEEGQPYLVVVDYAHTDDALRNLITAARELSPKRIITVFGCGGDRDRTKRPLMGAAAAELSDYVVLTSDNPRSEDPLAIINDASVGLRRFDTPHRLEPDRTKAIREAILEAGPGDIVLIAGKGHESYQILRDKIISYDDRAVARSVLRDLGHGQAIA